MADTYRRSLNHVPPAFQGADWHMEVGFLDTATGQAADFTIAPLSTLTLSTTIRGAGGEVLAVLDTTGTKDGLLTADAHGRISWDLPAAVVSNLPITEDYRADASTSMATWRPRGMIVFDLTVSDGTNTWSLLDSSARLLVYPQIGS